MEKKKIIRAATMLGSLGSFCKDILRELSTKYEVVGIGSPDISIEELEKRENIRVIPVYMERHISFAKDYCSLRHLIKIFKKEKPYLVHSMTPKAGLLCMIAAKYAKIPVRIHTFTGLLWPTEIGVKRKILILTDKITCACATHVNPEGQGVLNDLTKGGITKKSMRVLGYGNVKGVDLEYFRRRPIIIEKSNNLRDFKKITFIYVGRIVKDKGINELVSVFRRLYTKYPHVRLFLVGSQEESLDPVLPETIQTINNYDSIIATGRQIGDDLLAYYAASDCFVFPSYREGFPNTVLEAGAMELPSIVSDINGCREIIEDGVNGLIIPSKDEDALYEAMEIMIVDKDSRDKMASRARDYISLRFERGFVQKCLFDYYDEITSRL